MKWLNIRYNRYKNKSNVDDVDDGQRSSSTSSSTTSTSARLSPKQRKSNDNYNNQFKSPLTTSTLSMKKSSSSSTAAISTTSTTASTITTASSTTMVKNKISLVHHHKHHHHRKQIYKNNNNQNNENNNNDKQQLQPLSLQSYYTNSPWINKQQQQNFFDNNNNNNNNKSINFYKNLSSNTTLLLKQNNNHYYNQQCINYKRNYNDNILDILSDNRRSSSSSSSSTLLNPIDSTTNLIHNSIMYYVNQIRPIDQSDHQKSQQQQQNRRRFYEKPKAPPEPLNGTCITPFEVLIHGYLLHRIVGRGSFSTLYEASRLFVSHGGVACKHVRIGRPEDICLTDSDGRWRLQMQQYFLEEEIRILRQIRHPNIIQLYEIIIDDDNRNYYIMMKFAVNKTIANYLYQFYQKPLPETYAKRWTRQLMLAIQYLHEECRIAHRDLKLENFLLDEKYVALLTDFGLAISLSIHSSSSSSSASLNRNSPNHHHHHYMIDNNSYLKKFFDKNFVDQNQNHRTKRIETLLSIQCGTTEYMAPEILNQELQQQQQQMTAATTTLFNDTFPWCSYDPFRADIYSMGICLFEMLNYYRPFRWSSYNLNYINGGAFGSYNQNHNNNNLVWQQRNRQYRYNKRIYLTEECRDLIDEMLEPRAAIRPTSRQVLDHRWFKYSIR